MRREVAPAEVPTDSFPPPVLNVGFDFSGPYFSAGTRFAILLRSDSPIADAYTWYANESDTYPGGGVFGIYQGTQNSYPWDAHFRTYMAIPEPPTVVLAVVFVFGMAPFTRRLR